MLRSDPGEVVNVGSSYADLRSRCSFDRVGLDEGNFVALLLIR